MGNKTFSKKYLKQALSLSNDVCVNPQLQLIVCIPAYKEDDLIGAIKSLQQNSLDNSQYEIHVLINYPKGSNADLVFQSETQLQECLEMGAKTFIKEFDLKTAGVGLARKYLMDNAAKRFYEMDKPDGIILAFDADATCVNDHIAKVLKYFKANENVEAASIYFEHDLETSHEEINKYITEYELHLRTYINWKKYLALPYAFQTIGSSMAVRAGAYTAKGGMNKRKAGEDFYFLHKFTNGQRFGEIKSTTVFPSSRLSDRVPFGTGRAILEAINQSKEINTYNPQSYLAFKSFKLEIDAIQAADTLNFANLNPTLINFVQQIKIRDIIDECLKNSSSQIAFQKRFYSRFDAFMFMKYLHFMRDQAFPNVSSLEAANHLAQLRDNRAYSNTKDALIDFRNRDRQIL